MRRSRLLHRRIRSRDPLRHDLNGGRQSPIDPHDPSTRRATRHFPPPGTKVRGAVGTDVGYRQGWLTAMGR